MVACILTSYLNDGWVTTFSVTKIRINLLTTKFCQPIFFGHCCNTAFPPDISNWIIMCFSCGYLVFIFLFINFESSCHFHDYIEFIFIGCVKFESLEYFDIILLSALYQCCRFLFITLLRDKS